MVSGRVLVIGSNCFSGATFVAHLLEQGFEVLGISRSPEPADCLLPYKWGDFQRFRFVQADINSELDRIVAVVDQWQPRYVANYAAQGMVAQSWREPAQWFQTNTLAMVRLHDRLRTFSCIEKYLQISTPEVYGTTRGIVREDANYSPSTPYAASKAACDLSLISFWKGYRFPVVFTRSANVCGPGQQLYRIIPKTILSIMSGGQLNLEGGGVARRSFIHMRDVAEGQLKAMLLAKPGDIFHLSTDVVVSIREVVETICERLGVRFSDHVRIVAGRRVEDDAYLLDCSKAKSELGWTPRRDLDTIIRETVDWARRHWDVLRGLPLEYVHKP
jgi:dTDP-glucose 4,6-dehydratase